MKVRIILEVDCGSDARMNGKTFEEIKEMIKNESKDEYDEGFEIIDVIQAD